MRSLTVLGRVRSFRTAGSKLLFVDIVQDGRSVQGVVNVGRLKGHKQLDYLNFQHYLQRGDIVCKCSLSSLCVAEVESLHSIYWEPSSDCARRAGGRSYGAPHGFVTVFAFSPRAIDG